MKKIYDSLHGFIYLDHLEEKLIHSVPMMRLQATMQLGTAYLVYPGATHTRFEHSLGTMRIASKIFERIMHNTHSQWLPEVDSFLYHYYKRIVRIAALCHDLGHLPFSHSAETALLGKEGHEKWTQRIIYSDHLKPIWNEFKNELNNQSSDHGLSIEEDIAKLAIGPEKMKLIDPLVTFTAVERVMSEIITADLFGADRIDYLLRDSRSTGLAYGNIDHTQLIDSLCIQLDPETNDPFLGINEDGIESCEALLLARYFMHQRLCQYPSVKSYSFHITRFLESYSKENSFLDSVDSYLKVNDHIIQADICQASFDPLKPRHFDAQRLEKQKPRFKAYRMPKDIQEKDIEDIQKKLQIPEELIGWDFNPREKDHFNLSFLPFKPQEPLTYHWVFVDPTYKNSFLKVLGWNEKQITED